jgi:biotin transport system substrate-specific component
MTFSMTRHWPGLMLPALFAALLAGLGQLPTINLALGVPISAQSMAVVLAGCLLGPWRGMLAMLLFMLAVALGLPVLAGGRGGLAMLGQASAGFVLGWPLVAACCGALMTRLPGRTPLALAGKALLGGVLAGVLLMNLCGLLGLTLLTSLSLAQASQAVLVFVPAGLLKAALCASLVYGLARNGRCAARWLPGLQPPTSRTARA